MNKHVNLANGLEVRQSKTRTVLTVQKGLSEIQNLNLEQPHAESDKCSLEVLAPPVAIARVLDPELIPGTRRVRWEYALRQKPEHPRAPAWPYFYTFHEILQPPETSRAF